MARWTRRSERDPEPLPLPKEGVGDADPRPHRRGVVHQGPHPRRDLAAELALRGPCPGSMIPLQAVASSQLVRELTRVGRAQPDGLLQGSEQRRVNPRRNVRLGSVRNLAGGYGFPRQNLEQNTRAVDAFEGDLSGQTFIADGAERP